MRTVGVLELMSTRQGVPLKHLTCACGMMWTAANGGEKAEVSQSYGLTRMVLAPCLTFSSAKMTFTSRKLESVVAVCGK